MCFYFGRNGRPHHSSRFQLLGGLLALWLIAGAAKGAAAGVILESATLGPTGQSGGFSLDSDQFLGARFLITVNTVVDHVGGHIAGDFENGFAAIVSMPNGPTSLPSFLPADIDSSALASAIFDFPVGPFNNGFQSSTDLSIPLSVTLTPGQYALIFGSGAFGATGAGGMPFNNIDTAQASYFRSNNGQWLDGGISNIRFTVDGTPGATAVPEPSSLVLFVTGGMTLLMLNFRPGRRPEPASPELEPSEM